MDLDAPLDFETEDPLLTSSLVNKKRKKIIGLDDLLTDHFKQKSKLIEKEKKRAKAKKDYNSDDDESGKEALLSNIVNSCQNQMEGISGEEEIAEWGLQKTPPCLVPKLESCEVLQSFANDEVNSLVELSTEKGIGQQRVQGRKRLQFDDIPKDTSRSSVEQFMKQRHRFTQMGTTVTPPLSFPTLDPTATQVAKNTTPTKVSNQSPIVPSQQEEPKGVSLSTPQTPKNVNATCVMNQSVSFEGERISQLNNEELVNLAIANAYRAVFTFSLAQDKAKDIVVDQKRLLIERETLLKRMVELENQLAVERALVALGKEMSANQLAKLENIEEQLEDANEALERQKRKNAELVEFMETIPALEKAAVKAYQYSSEFVAIKSDEYLKGVIDCQAEIADRYPRLDLSFLDRKRHISMTEKEC